MKFIKNYHKYKRIVLIIVSTAVLFLGFYSDFWKAADKIWFDNHQRDSESIVVAKLIHSKYYGIYSNYGLLTYLSSDINDNYNRYTKNNVPSENEFKNYTSQIGLQGIVFSSIQKISTLSSEANLKFFKAINSLLLAIILTLFIYWISKEFNSIISSIVMIMIAFSPWLTIFGRNLYWVPWTWYLPMAISTGFLFYENAKGRYYDLYVCISLMISVFIKSACGYEYISTILISLTIPYFYYGIVYKWGYKKFFIRFISIACSALIGFGLAICLHTFQLTLLTGSIGSALEIIKNNIIKRTYASDTSIFPDAIRESLKVPVSVVLQTYFKGMAVDLTTIFNKIPKSAFFVITFNNIINWFIGATLLCFISEKYSKRIDKNRAKLIAVAACTWISILAPLSWFILAKAHSYIHSPLNFVLWYIPFVLFGFILISSVFYYIVLDIKGKIAYEYNKLSYKVKRRFLVLSSTVACSVCIISFYGINSRYVSNDKEVEIAQAKGVTVEVNTNIKVVANENYLYYFINNKAYKNISENYFFMHIYPQNLVDLKQDRQQYGYDNLDFLFKDKQINLTFWSKFRQYKIAKIEIPAYIIKSINTGQYNGGDRLWSSSIDKELISNNKFNRIMVANISDNFWENGIFKNDNILLFNYSWINYLLAQNSKFMLLEDKSIRKIVDIQRPSLQWIHIKYEGERINSQLGYPKVVEFKR